MELIQYAQYVLALVFVLALIALLAWVVKYFARGGPAGMRKQSRLGVVETAMVDRKRHLVLIRRDGVEHLLLIGGPEDLVVEQGIRRDAQRPAAQEPARRPPQPARTVRPAQAAAPAPAAAQAPEGDRPPAPPHRPQQQAERSASPAAERLVPDHPREPAREAAPHHREPPPQQQRARDQHTHEQRTHVPATRSAASRPAAPQSPAQEQTQVPEQAPEQAPVARQPRQERMAEAEPEPAPARRQPRPPADETGTPPEQRTRAPAPPAPEATEAPGTREPDPFEAYFIDDTSDGDMKPAGEYDPDEGLFEADTEVEAPAPRPAAGGHGR